MALSDLILTDRLTNANPVTIPGVSNLTCSWEYSGIGLLSCQVPLRDLLALGLTTSNIWGKWLKYTHYSGQVWGGIVTGVAGTDGIITISGESWARALKGLIVRGFKSPVTFSTIRQFLLDNQATTGIIPGGIEVSETAFGNAAKANAFVDGANFFDQTLPALIDPIYSDPLINTRFAGWYIDPQVRTLSIRTDYTFYLSESKIVAGDSMMSSAWATESTPPINTVILTGDYQWGETVTIPGEWYCTVKGVPLARCPAGKKKQRPSTQDYRSYKEVGKTVTVNTSDVYLYGVEARSFNLSGDTVFNGMSAMQNAAQILLGKLQIQQGSVTVEIANRPSGFAPTSGNASTLFGLFRPGMSVRVEFGHSLRSGNVQILSMALDVGRDVMTISGNADIGN